MKIAGLQKTSLLDFPGRLCCTVFTEGCNLRCPFCHNSSLVVAAGTNPLISEQELLRFLKKRQGLLDGVCITGGEPLMQEGIGDLMRTIKKLGFLIKLDTNGAYPQRLAELCGQGLVDYVAMDIKNSREHYGATVGRRGMDTADIEESAAFLLEGNIPYEFRTTIVKEFHTREDIESIGRWIQGAKNYALQNFEASEQIIGSGLHAHSKAVMDEFLAIAGKYVQNACLRGL